MEIRLDRGHSFLIYAIPESGKGRGESDGGDIEPRILIPQSRIVFGVSASYETL
ncbi:hypothetical protein OAL42_02250 [Akkermansiaceae bacterium]|nr:hypothetical protein [Akkermansiaceae bacterium]